MNGVTKEEILSLNEGIGRNLALAGAITAGAMIGGVPQVDSAVYQHASAKLNISQSDNNPCNIRDEKDSVKWQGKVGIDSKGFVRFSSLVYGFRAAVKNLMTNQRNNPKETVEQYIMKFANTSKHGDKVSYVEHVAKGMGVDKHSPIHNLDPYRFVALQAEVESGRKIPFTPELQAKVKKVL